jgi:hypothetical protein
LDPGVYGPQGVGNGVGQTARTGNDRQQNGSQNQSVLKQVLTGLVPVQLVQKRDNSHGNSSWEFGDVLNRGGGVQFSIV